MASLAFFWSSGCASGRLDHGVDLQASRTESGKANGLKSSFRDEWGLKLENQGPANSVAMHASTLWKALLEASLDQRTSGLRAASTRPARRKSSFLDVFALW